MRTPFSLVSRSSVLCCRVAIAFSYWSWTQHTTTRLQVQMWNKRHIFTFLGENVNKVLFNIELLEKTYLKFLFPPLSEIWSVTTDMRLPAWCWSGSCSAEPEVSVSPPAADSSSAPPPAAPAAVPPPPCSCPPPAPAAAACAAPAQDWEPCPLAPPAGGRPGLWVVTCSKWVHVFLFFKVMKRHRTTVATVSSLKTTT